MSRVAGRTDGRRNGENGQEGLTDEETEQNKQAYRSIELDTGMLDKKERKGLSEKRPLIGRRCDKDAGEDTESNI